MRFCSGHPERGVRPLTASERAGAEAALRHLTRRAAAGLFLLGAPFVAVGLVAWVVTSIRPAGDPASGAVIGVLALFALLAGVPVTLAIARHGVRAALALRRDLRRGEALVFGDGPRAVAVLPDSRRGFRSDAAGVLGPPLVVGEAAAPPPDPATYALPAADVPEAVRAAGWVRRALTPEERAEVERHAARLGRVPLSLLLFSVVFAALAAAALSRAPEGRPGLLPAVAWLVLLGLGWWRVVRGRTEAARLRADAAEGWVYRAAAEAGRDEFLPGSGAPWSEDGGPAEWRLRRG